jgi:hypothetical protein
VEISRTNIWASYVIFLKLPKLNNRLIGENSPNLVTLIRAVVDCKEHWCKKVHFSQGDQIGGNFASWVIVNFGQILKITEANKKIYSTFFRKLLFINFDKNGLGNILGDIFFQSHLVTLTTGQLNTKRTAANQFHP